MDSTATILQYLIILRPLWTLISPTSAEIMSADITAGLLGANTAEQETQDARPEDMMKTAMAVYSLAIVPRPTGGQDNSHALLLRVIGQSASRIHKVYEATTI